MALPFIQSNIHHSKFKIIFGSMLKILEVLWSSFKMALQELRVNKLRTFLSLFGITIGIFCIIGVLATISSLKYNIQESVSTMGANTIYIQKEPWGDDGGPNSWWKYANRPNPKYEELEFIKKRSSLAQNVAFITFSGSNVEYKESQLNNVTWYAVTEEYSDIQPIDVAYGRYLSANDFLSGSNAMVLGYANAEKLFGNPERAVGKEVSIKGRKVQIVGVMKKYGQSNFGGWDFDNILIVPYLFARSLINEKYAGGILMAKGAEDLPVQALKEDLTGVMRSIRKLSPTQEDNFALNEISAANDFLDSIFGSINAGGWAIAALSLIVGAFGVANIMFVTVRERTSQIGLKKAIGAKKSIILTEFLLESAFLCIIGGLVGVLLVFILTKILSAAFGFAIFVSVQNLALAISICILLGVLSGIIPARTAARLDPVVAIRTK